MTLLDRVTESDRLAELDPAQRRLALRELLAGDVPAAALGSAVAEVSDLIDGYGPLTSLMADEAVTDILVNEGGEIWAEREGFLERSNVAFRDREEVLALAVRWIEQSGGRADVGCPIADARLPCGARLHVVLPPIAPNGPLISIRKFAPGGFTLEDLLGRSAITPSQAGDLRSLVDERNSLVIAGATGTGKTTLLNALLELVDPSERVVTIEETPELHVCGSHVVSLLTRQATVQGHGSVPARLLVCAALRMRPDRIVVGEVRGDEAFDALAALSTGHKGSMMTVHAGSADSAMERLTMLALGAGTGATESFLRAQFEQAIDAVVYLERAGAARIVADIVRV